MRSGFFKYTRFKLNSQLWGLMERGIKTCEIILLISEHNTWQLNGRQEQISQSEQSRWQI